MSMSLVLSLCVSFVSLIHFVNGAQFLIFIFFLLFAPASAAAMFGTVIIAITNIYTLLLLHKIELKIEVLNLILLLTL